MSRRLRVLAGHPQLGVPGHIRDEFDGAQAFVDLGYAEWILDRSLPVETTERALHVEVASQRPTPRARARRRNSETR